MSWCSALSRAQLMDDSTEVWLVCCGALALATLIADAVACKPLALSCCCMAVAMPGALLRADNALAAAAAVVVPVAV